MVGKLLTMKLLKGHYAVCRFNKGHAIPEWAYIGSFFSITSTMDELSIVCNEDNLPEGITCSRGWSVLKIQGPLDFSLIGILSGISSILASKGISIFAVSTYDTDYILVKNNDIEDAIAALAEENYEIKRE